MTTSKGGKKNPLPDNYETKDHLTPIMRSGQRVKSGTVQCCNKCNMEKGCLTFEEFRAVHAYRNNKSVVSPGKIFAGEKSLWKLVDIGVVIVLLLAIKKGFNL